MYGNRHMLRVPYLCACMYGCTGMWTYECVYCFTKK